MRILYFHQHFSTPTGSVGTRSYEFARRLVARGHQVTMVCGSYAMADTGLTGEAIRGIRRGDVDGIDVLEIVLEYSNYDSLPKRSWTAFRFAWKSIRIAFREPYDLLFATSTPLTAGIPGIAMRLLRPAKKFVFEVRDLWPELPRAMGVVKNPLILGAMSILERTSYAAMHAGVALSPGIAAGMRQRSPAGTGIELIPNGCDLQTFRPAQSSCVNLPEPYPRSGFRCIFSGAHGRANGLDAVVDAAAKLRDRGRDDIHLVFIGDGKQKPALRARCQREDLTNCVFLDPLPKYELAELLRHAELGLMILANVPAFYYGTSPNKFFDYAAAGLPILNNYPGWLAEMIAEHRCGIAVPPADADAFADALIELADAPEERAAMSVRARRLAETRFDRESLANQFVDLLERIARSPRQAAEPIPSTSPSESIVDDVEPSPESIERVET